MVQEREGFRTVAYFVNWAIYGRDHHPQDLLADKLTHVLYAFANVRSGTGEVFLTDTWSDLEKHYPGDKWDEPTPGPHIYGCLKQLALLKKQNRNLKTLLSIGGWTYSNNFTFGTSTPAARQRFADSAVTLLKDCGFDGLDIDWEYPGSEAEASNYVKLLATVREALNKYAVSRQLRPDQFLLTVASPAGPHNYTKMHIGEMDKYLDFWNLMGYDYAGSWDSKAGHHANVYPSRSNESSTPFNTHAAITYYVNHGVKPSKIVLGCPLYGRAFEGTAGPGQPYNGVGEGSWEAGIWDWKVLPHQSPSNKVHEDRETIASFSYDSATKKMVSFDSIEAIGGKVGYIIEHKLGGMMWWETSGDRKQGQGSAIERVADMMGDGVERKRNVIAWPDSRFQNLRDGFPGENATS